MQRRLGNNFASSIRHTYTLGELLLQFLQGHTLCGEAKGRLVLHLHQYLEHDAAVPFPWDGELEAVLMLPHI